MPLQHSHEHDEQTVPLRTFAQQETPIEAALTSSAPRYDAATVKQIIALAEQMQSHHRQTLAPKEVEALGHEVGVEPEFIRRALMQVEAGAVPVAKAGFSYQEQSATGQTTAATVTETSVEPLVFQLTRKQGCLLMVPLALYLLALPYTLGRLDLGNEYGSIVTPVLLYCIVPAVLALYLAGKGKSYRFGALLGAVMGLACVGSVLVNAAITNHYTPSLEEIRTLASVWTATGLALGISGAAVGKVIRRARVRTNRPKQTKRRLRVRVVMENTE